MAANKRNPAKNKKLTPQAIAKPTKVIEIEKAYGIILSQYLESNNPVANAQASYSLNDKGDVISLNLYDLDIKEILPILNLIHLKHLNLTRNKIENLDGISSLFELKELFVGGNKIKSLKPLLGCKNLEEFAIWGNPVDDPYVLYELDKLSVLYCQSINFSDCHFPSLSKQLIELSIGGCGINDIEGIEYLTKLGYFAFDNNLVEDITPCLKLKSLIAIDAGNNLITFIHRDLSKRFNWLHNSLNDEFMMRRHEERLGLYSNPLFFPPASVVELGQETVQSYYDNAERYGHAPLSEGRIIVIGDGSAGKSSLIERLLHDTFEQGKNQTDGIRIENWELSHSDGRQLAVHFWDFGGQEIQHAVHKFFFTEGCLYILVLDNRKEEEPEYWLQQIESLGGSAPVLVVFNKYDDNASEIADRKFLKEKYPNILGFYNTSCKTGFGIQDFKNDLKSSVVKLRTVDEQFPNNWFAIKQAIAEHTSGEQHYINYEYFKSICVKNNVLNEEIQKLLLRYLTTIGAVTWFGDTYLNFLHILSPAWITQGVYKIITSKKTSSLYGSITVANFSELLKPIGAGDYIYDEGHYGYLLSMMKKFDLCYTANDKDILIPSAFGKMPKVEYGDYRGEGVQTYILAFKDYMPLALIHRFIAKRIEFAFEGNFWYSGIVIRDERSDSLAMVHADKEAKRIYVRIKGDSQLGVWEHVRRELSSIITSYASINYVEYVSLDPHSVYLVSYDELIGHIRVGRPVYFHAGLGREFNVGQLMGMFESKEATIKKFKTGEHKIEMVKHQEMQPSKTPPVVIQLLNYNNNVNNNNNSINISIEQVKSLSSDIQGEANYLIEQIGVSNKALVDALSKIVEFTREAKKTTSDDDLKEKGWGRKLKSIVEVLSKSGDHIKKIKDGGEAMHTIADGIHKMAAHLNMHDISIAYHQLEQMLQQIQ